LIRSPEWSGTIGAEWRHDTSYGEFVLSGNYAFTSRIWFDVLNRVGQDAYGLLGLRAVWNAPGDRYSVAVFGTNVTDERYLVGGSFTPSADSVYAGAPRQYGVTLQAKF
jgi:iron complex outermembrane recepter protein